MTVFFLAFSGQSSMGTSIGSKPGLGFIGFLGEGSDEVVCRAFFHFIFSKILEAHVGHTKFPDFHTLP